MNKENRLAVRKSCCIIQDTHALYVCKRESGSQIKMAQSAAISVMEWI